MTLTLRFGRARKAAGLPPLRFHGLRQTYGSPPVGGGDRPGKREGRNGPQISTTERYLHARPASELAERFTRAFAGSTDASITGSVQAPAQYCARFIAKAPIEMTVKPTYRGARRHPVATQPFLRHAGKRSAMLLGGGFSEPPRAHRRTHCQASGPRPGLVTAHCSWSPPCPCDKAG